MRVLATPKQAKPAPKCTPSFILGCIFCACAQGSLIARLYATALFCLGRFFLINYPLPKAMQNGTDFGCYTQIGGVAVIVSCLCICYIDTNRLSKDSTREKIDSVKTLFSLLEICRKTVETVADACSEKLVSKSTLIGNVNQYILQNYASGITLQDISAKLFVNSSYLSRVYKKQTGNTITDTINLYRVKVAKQLLREHDCKIYEVCSLVGIDNPAYFTRVFIKYAGCTPTEYKDGCH